MRIKFHLKKVFNKLQPSQIKKLKIFSDKEGAALYGSDGIMGFLQSQLKILKK